MKGRYMSHPSGGPAWSRDCGYHTPTLPAHITRILTTNSARVFGASELRRVDSHGEFSHTRHCITSGCYEEVR
jgi:hypothetical protein